MLSAHLGRLVVLGRSLFDPCRYLSAHAAAELLEVRSVPPENSDDGPFWFEHHDQPPRLFFGHAVLAEPFVSDTTLV